MSDPLGLSIGTTNLVAVRIDNQANQPLTRRPAFALPDGVMMTGLVERLGDSVPLVAPDGSLHSAERLLVEALAELVDSSGGKPSADVTVAVPAHWETATVQTLRNAMRGHSTLGADGMPARLVSDATASLRALQANPGLPAQGVVVLLDFGAAEPASRWPTQGRHSSRSARPSGTRSSPATGWTRRCCASSSTSWRPQVGSIPRVPPRWDH